MYNQSVADSNEDPSRRNVARLMCDTNSGQNTSDKMPSPNTRIQEMIPITADTKLMAFDA